MLYVMFMILCAPFFWLIYRPIVLNRKRLKIKGKAIFVSNHLAAMDPVLLASISPRLIHFMGKAELFDNPLIALFLKSLLAFPVNRKRADMASIKNAMRLLDEGKVFGIFPEGKRSVTGELDDLEKGAAFLAVRSGAPIVPICIRPDSYKNVRFRAAVGEPIYAKELDVPKSQLTDALTGEIVKSMQSLRAQVDTL